MGHSEDAVRAGWSYRHDGLAVGAGLLEQRVPGPDPTRCVRRVRVAHVDGLGHDQVRLGPVSDLDQGLASPGLAEVPGRSPPGPLHSGQLARVVDEPFRIGQTVDIPLY